MLPQLDLLKELTKLTFVEEAYSCVFLLCKNPKLYSLLCCEFAKTELSSPFPVGTHFYYPIKDSNKYRKVIICEVMDMYGCTWYKFAWRQGSSEICYESKRVEDFESIAILAQDQESDDWIQGNNVSSNYLHSHLGTSFPTIVSQFREFENVLSVKVDGSTLCQLLDVNTVDDLKNKVNFISENKIKPDSNRHLVWVNTVPYKIENYNIVLLSPTHSRFPEFKTDIENLFLRTDSVKVYKIEELSPNLSHSVILTSATNPVSIWGLQ
ncbi:hypothetical protein KW493_06270 [Vibrio fluvialis]|nr:hypothetical protein [Vibrio fluvialis]MBY7848344.1 hypothetical protein [Vibrio fluvialis]MBY8127881.1 hypothetical protein [Vibrio fluvialis]